MRKMNKSKILILLASLILLFGVSVQTTLAYLTVNTEPVTNTFVPVQTVEHDLNITVTGDKDLKGRDWQEGDSFTFMLQQWDGQAKEWVTKGTASVAYDKEKKDFDKFDMSGLVQEQLTAPGTYSFRIVEGEGSLANVTYDEKACRFDVTVKADSRGAMDISAVTNKENTTVTKDSSTGDYSVAVRFTNTFTKPVDPPKPPDPDDIKVDINVEKVMKNEGAGEIGPEGFNFTLVKDSTKETLTETSDKDGNAVFDLTFTKDDIGKTYIYELSEVNDGEEYVTYSDAIYQIKISIELNDDNELVPTITCDDKVVKNVDVKFENIYDKPEGPTKPTDPDDPTKPGDPDDPKDDGSQTGDDSNMTLFVLILLTSVAVMALVVIPKRRKN